LHAGAQKLKIVSWMMVKKLKYNKRKKTSLQQEKAEIE